MESIGVFHFDRLFHRYTQPYVTVMSITAEDVIPENFSGIVPLFPLPNLVMFPGVVQPLQIFESRYKAMMKWTLKHERLIAMAILKPEWETDQGSPPIHPVVCIGKVIAHTKLEDGRYKLLLMGGKRAFIENELSAPQPFRTAQVTLMNDVSQDDHDGNRREVLSRKFLHYLRNTLPPNEQLDELLRKRVSLGLLTDIVASVLDLPPERKYELLEQTNTNRRAEMLISELVAHADNSTPVKAHGFPPNFSAN